MSDKDNALDALFKKPAFASLGEKRIAMFRQFAKEIDGKNPAEIAARFVRLNMQISKDQPLATAEREAIYAAIKESLPEEDKQKYSKVLKLI